jgi:hypothetical protein
MAGERGVSCNVLVIPEDPTYNGYILKPLVSKLLAICGRGNANVEVLTDPKVSGFEHACRSMPEIVDRYDYKHLLLFLPDRDGKDRGPLFANLEAEHGPKLICCAAVEEVEAWLLAGHISKLDRPWPTVRADISVKENVFAPFLREHGDSRYSGGGREQLMQQTLTNLRGLLERCPELARLQERICEALA